MKKEFEYDLTLKGQLEKNPDFIDFLHALEKLSVCISESNILKFGNKIKLIKLIDRFLLGDLFSYGDSMGDLFTSARSERTKSRVDYDFAMNDEDPMQRSYWKKQYRDSILNPTMSESPPKNLGVSQDLGKDQGKSKEIDELKQQLLNLQAQMTTIQKTMVDISQGQNNLKTNINKQIDEKLANTKAVVPAVPSSGVSNEYLETLKRSGVTPQEFEANLGYIKQVYQVLRIDEKQDMKSLNNILAKTNGKLEIEKYTDLSLGNSEDEIKIMIILEYYLSNNRLVDAMRLIKWRKKIIKLAQMNGWDVASIIAERTIHKLGKYSFK